MKRVILSLFSAILACVLPAFAQKDTITLTPKVDRRVELLSIVFRLAGNPEYNMNTFRKYAGDIDEYFRPSAAHPVVALAKQLAARQGVGFDAVMAMAVHLSQPPELKPVVDFTDNIPEPRWGQTSASQFASLLADFYKTAGAEKFFRAHEGVYRAAERSLAEAIRSIDMQWFKRYYGALPAESYALLIGVNNGGGNYGPRVVHPDGREDLFSIIGVSDADSAGNPAFDKGVLLSIVHEFSHSFVNPAVDRHLGRFEDEATAVFTPIADQMKRMAYGDPRTMVVEALVRASVIRYLRAHDSGSVNIPKLIMREQANGFVFMDELDALMGKYEKDRGGKPTFESFMPNIVDFFVDISQRIGDLVKSFDEKCVHVTSIAPFANGAIDVAPSIAEIIVHCDRELDPAAGYSIDLGAGGREHFPIAGKPAFEEKGRTLRLPVRLKPDWEYSFVLTPLAFASADGHPLMTYTITFRTKK